MQSIEGFLIVIVFQWWASMQDQINSIHEFQQYVEKKTFLSNTRMSSQLFSIDKNVFNYIV